jgi:tetratricopeptide (TPR) repeat protein
MLEITRQPEKAAAQYRAALGFDPAHLKAGHQLAVLLKSAGKTAEAVAQYRRVLDQDPTHLHSLCNLARLLATAHDAACRDGADAVRLAERAASLTPQDDIIVLDTLAAAYAEAKRWDEAKATEARAIRLAESKKLLQAIPSMRQRLDSYESHRPWRE